MTEEKQPLLVLLVDAVAQEYASDPSTASVVLASLPTGEKYASVVRYRKAYGEDKVVVCGAKGATMGKAVRFLAERWTVQSAPKSPAGKELGRLVGPF